MSFAPGGVDELVTMAKTLCEFGLYSLSQDQGAICLGICRRLQREGVNEQCLRLLFAYAKETGHTPIRLFAWWLKSPARTLQKLQELRQHSAWATRVLRAEQKPLVERDGTLLNHPRWQAKTGR